jgi:hypothetical protein
MGFLVTSLDFSAKPRCCRRNNFVPHQTNKIQLSSKQTSNAKRKAGIKIQTFKDLFFGIGSAAVILL